MQRFLNSYTFIFLFLPATLMAYFSVGRFSIRYAAALLSFASLVFYSYWSVKYLGLLLASISLNFFFAKGIAIGMQSQRGHRGRVLFWLAVIANLLLLGYYKYANFFLQNFSEFTHLNVPTLQLALPLGISFFTFTQIAFLADTYQGKVKDFNFLHYLLFITYFPHLIAGPILHHGSIIPQFQKKSTYSVNWINLATGILLFSAGLFKKVFWADSLAPFADTIFSEAQKGLLLGIAPTVYEAWAGALAYTLQIYFDFSGYTDMALGVALMFNTRLPINFNSPYQSTSIIEFWRRWHISLSSFLRDYLYIPLGGSRQGKGMRYRNLLLTMLIGGIWHGAGWTFIAWGCLHGLMLAANHLWRELPVGHGKPWMPSRLRSVAFGLPTFVSVVVAWVFFRAQSMEQALGLLRAMFGMVATPIAFEAVANGHLLVRAAMDSKELAQLLVFGLLWVWLLPNSNRVRFWQGGKWVVLAQVALVCLVLCLCINRFGSYSPFLYYQF